MKLTVVPPDRLDAIVPQISAFSNTQNRVTASDLKANGAFHVEIERIMRGLWAPPSPLLLTIRTGSMKEPGAVCERYCT